MAINFNNLAWIDGQDNVPGIAPVGYYVLKSQISTFPGLKSAPEDMGDHAVIDTDFELSSGIFYTVYGSQRKGKIESVNQGQPDCKTFLNKYVFIYPGSFETVKGWCRQMNNSDVVFLARKINGEVIMIGHRYFKTSFKVIKTTGSSPSTLKGCYVEVSCTHEAPLPVYTGEILLVPLLKDIDGNVYTTVTIGSLEFIVENFRSTKYADGSTIPLITENATWAADTVGAMCYYSNDVANKSIYGALYNWRAVKNAAGLAYLERGGVNQNYRIPTKTDFETLINELGGNSVAGGKLKEAGLTHWLTPNTGATNSSGFTGLPGGNRLFDGSFTFVNRNGNFWTDTESASPTAWFCYITFNSAYAQILAQATSRGYSVRLVRDVVL